MGEGAISRHAPESLKKEGFWNTCMLQQCANN
jgi:hypothetical protein